MIPIEFDKVAATISEQQTTSGRHHFEKCISDI
jgi:hypothetical protein